MCLSIFNSLGHYGTAAGIYYLNFHHFLVFSVFFERLRSSTIFEIFDFFSVIFFGIFFSREFFSSSETLKNVEDEVEDEDGFEMARRTPFSPLLTTVQHG